jgi:hypothetical protein
MVVRRYFVPKREEVTGDWRKLYNEQLIDMIQVIKSRRMR